MTQIIVFTEKINLLKLFLIIRHHQSVIIFYKVYIEASLDNISRSIYNKIGHFYREAVGVKYSVAGKMGILSGTVSGTT